MQDKAWHQILLTNLEPRTIKYSMELSFFTIANIYVRDRDYTVHVSICTSNGHIHVFKYDEERVCCQYEVFDNHYDAADYLELLL